jgi:hypothetical protein
LEDPAFGKAEESSVPPMTTAMTTAMTTTTTTATATTTTTSSAPQQQQQQQQQQQGYRILEAVSPPQSIGGSGSGTGNGNGNGNGNGGAGGGSAGSGYHVLEAPTIVPGSAQRSAASDVLEKARNRFDKFWGKGNNGNTEN